VLEDYFARSEQLATRLWLAADGERAAGLLLQRLPNRDSDDPDAWERATTLADTLKDAELLGLPAEQVLTRLFHEEQVRVYDPEPVAFRCTCSADKVGGMLRGLGVEEVRSVVAEQGEVRVNCEFCGRPYVWDAVEVERLFAAGPTPEGPDTHQ
jgi:molecular chaperone Hsp33